MGGGNTNRASDAKQKHVRDLPKVEAAMEGQARWFFAWGDENSFHQGYGAPLGDDDGLALELSMVRGGAEIVVREQGGLAIRADARSRTGIAVDGGCRGILVRGTWFFERYTFPPKCYLIFTCEFCEQLVYLVHCGG